MRKLSIFLTLVLILTFGQAFAQVCDIQIVNVAGSWDDLGVVKLNNGQTIQVTMHLNNSCGVAGEGYNPSNAYLMWSPDGTDWGYTKGSWLAGWTGLSWTKTFLNHFEWTGTEWVKTADSVTGSHAITAAAIAGDSTGVLFAGISFDPGCGLATGSDIDGYTIEFTTPSAEGGTICLDTGFVPGGVWKWANAGGDIFPEWTGQQCWTVEQMPNEPPVVSGPTNYSFNHCDGGVIDFTADEAENDVPYVWEIVSGPGVINSTANKTARWEWTGPSVPQSGNPTLVVRAKDNFGTNHWGNEFTVNLTVENEGPSIVCPTERITVQAGATDTYQTVVTDDDCDALTITASYSGAGSVNVVGENVYFTPVEAEEGDVEFYVIVDDGEYVDSCQLLWNVIVGAPYIVTIEKIHNQIQGQFTDVTVELGGIDAPEGFGAFDILIAYDNSALSFQQALEGEIYDECGWEYFTYRFGPDGNCGNACPSGMTRVVGIAETNNGPNHPGCATPTPYVDEATLPVTLFSLRFLVSNDRTLECQFVPVRFFWVDCGDNTLSNFDGTKLFVSAKVFDYDNAVPVNNGTVGFPTYQGAQDECLVVGPGDKEPPIRYVDFYNGGVDIVCADSIDARGDLNLNGLAYEIADAVMFTNYFITGLGAFEYVDGSVAASDCNADGITLTVADLVYLIRVVIGDALPYPKTAPVAASFTSGNGVLSIDSDMGAAFVVLEGQVTPTLLANNMEMKYAFDGTNTRVLVFSTIANQTFAGEFLRANGSVVSAEFATYDGQPVTAKEVPSTFALEQNYPNPFNPTTKIDFAIPGGGAYTLTIYNVTGQIVDEMNGVTEGFETVNWDASGLASGIYFYKLTANNQTMTKKAILLK